MRAENYLSKHQYDDAHDSRAWYLASCLPGIGLITGCFREASLHYALNEAVASVNNRTRANSPEDRLVIQKRACDLTFAKTLHHLFGVLQNLLSIALLASLTGTGVIQASSLNIGLISGAGALFLGLALRNIYQVNKGAKMYRKIQMSTE